MGAEESFDQELQRFYDECSDEERDAVAYMCMTTLVVTGALGYEVEGFEGRAEWGLESAQPMCLRDGEPSPPVSDDAINRDLFPRDEYFLNNDDALERPAAC